MLQSFEEKMPRPDLERMAGVGWLIRQRLSRAAWSAFPEQSGSAFNDCSRCHCGRCARYARCKFSNPRNVGDVLHNISRTGSTAGARICVAATALDHFASDVVLAFGMGAGSCVAGWEIARGAPLNHVIGVEVEPLAARVAEEAFPSAKIHPTLDEVLLPASGRLVVITSLVLNLITVKVARVWVDFLAGARRDFLHVTVGRAEEPGQLAVFESALTGHGMRPERHNLPPDIDKAGDGYATRATHWRR
jgi:precorrin-6B methylase 2